MIDIAGYFLATLMGLTLGLMGGGGSILTVPIFVYVLNINPVKATSYSLFVVGAAALFGAIRYHLKGLLDYKAAALFGFPSLFSVYLTRRYLIPAIPADVFSINGFLISKAILIMFLFATLMVAAATFMIGSNGKIAPPRNPHLTLQAALLIALEGSLVGVVTGSVGAGGGFLIVPSLVLLVGLPMKEAVATSLLVIAIQSLAGVVGDLQAHVAFDWIFLGYFLGFTLGGMLLGTYLAPYVSDVKLKHTFGWFVMILGVAMLGGQIRAL